MEIQVFCRKVHHRTYTNVFGCSIVIKCLKCYNQDIYTHNPRTDYFYITNKLFTVTNIYK